MALSIGVEEDTHRTPVETFREAIVAVVRRYPTLLRVALSLRRSLRNITRKFRGADTGILQQYVTSAPEPQHAVDIFRGEWWSVLPDVHGKIVSGNTPLFEDTRVTLMLQKLGGVVGMSVLELGPLEGGHTYMLERAGASEIVAIEANTRAYLKCLISKELYGLTRSKFLCGDFEAYLRTTSDKFDLCLASGVLYHLRNPVELLFNVSRVAESVYLWTHYYSELEVSRIPHIGPKMRGESQSEVHGFKHTVHEYNYEEFLDTNRFAGGTKHYSSWLSKDDILDGLKFFGFEHLQILEEDRDHVNGPCISLLASKKRSTN